MAALFNTSIRFMFTSNKTFLVHVPVVYFNDQSVLSSEDRPQTPHQRLAGWFWTFFPVTYSGQKAMLIYDLSCYSALGRVRKGFTEDKLSSFIYALHP